MSEWQSSWTPKIGMRVVCVDASDWDIYHVGHAYPEIFPVYGKIYTIEGVEESFACLALYLEEIPATQGNWMHCWDIRRFRPLLKRKTDISQLTAMLKDTRESIDA